MNEYDRIIYILWRDAAVEHYMQHDDGSGTLFINRVNLSQEGYALT